MKTPDTPVSLIVGLGNPGPEYAHTRHNAGQQLVTELASRFSAPLTPSAKFFGTSGRVLINRRDVRLLIPTTFMNRSGQAVAAIAQFYKTGLSSILVVHDELDLEPGVARFKIGGGHGGHNGLRDIISACGNNKNFGRLRLGIGHPGNAKQVSNYVLKSAPSDQQQCIDDAIESALRYIPNVVSGDWESAMRELHSQ